MSNWDPSKHPRVPSGSSGGGQFGAGSGGDALDTALIQMHKDNASESRKTTKTVNNLLGRVPVGPMSRTAFNELKAKLAPSTDAALAQMGHPELINHPAYRAPSLLVSSRTASGQRQSPLAVSVSRMNAKGNVLATIHAGLSMARGYNPVKGRDIKPAAVRTASRVARSLNPSAKSFSFKVGK